MNDQKMILCGGLQSGGTTLVSWCFLQRRDTDGVLDMAHDRIRTDFSAVDRSRHPILWVKMTIGAFRWWDVCGIYHDLGYDPRPLLVIRDVRPAYASLMQKDYGFNGLTAEEPPLRTRFRRFHEDWRLFRARGWPVIRYEDFLADGRGTLERACTALGLAFDEQMIRWAKGKGELSYPGEASNETFARSITAGSLPEAMIQGSRASSIESLPHSELAWLEQEFSQYNQSEGYAAHVDPPAGAARAMAPPSFEYSARDWFEREVARLQEENAMLRRQIKAEATDADPRGGRPVMETMEGPRA